MPSDYFISNDGRDAALDSYLRLNFSFANEEDAQRGLAILVNLIKSTQKRNILLSVITDDLLRKSEANRVTGSLSHDSADL